MNSQGCSSFKTCHQQLFWNLLPLLGADIGLGKENNGRNSEDDEGDCKGAHTGGAHLQNRTQPK
jgi:hypothetical protein